VRLLRTGLLFAFLALIAVTPSVTAQEATPTPLGAEHCTVDPIDPDAYNAAIMASIPPMAADPNPTGTPADDATVAAVTDTIEQSIACTNIGDLGRLLAVIDPAYAPTLLGVALKDVPAAVEAAAATSVHDVPATPLVDDIDQGALVSRLLGVENVQVLDNGQVSAQATVQRLGYPVFQVTIYLRMDESLGRYIITNYTSFQVPLG